MSTSAICGTILLLFIASFVSLAYSLNGDGLSLLALKAAITTDPTRVLSTWSDTDYTPCLWVGISCDHNHQVTSIFLPSRGFTGYLPSELGALLSLRRLSLPHNNFSGAIPSHLFNATHLLSLDLSHNSLTSPIPYLITSLQNLNHLDLSSNLLNGSLPQGLDNLPNLAGTVNFSYNHFTGEVPSSYGLLPLMVILDLRNNNLTGKIPLVGSLLNQGPTSFSGNPYLCGFPLQTACAEPEAQNPRVNSVPKNPTFSKNGLEEGGRGKVGSVTVPIISGVTVVIGVAFVSALMLRKKWRRSEEEEEERRKRAGKEEEKEEKGGQQKGKFVVVGEGLGFELELEELLRASARVVGKSRSGIVYKVVVGRGAGTVLAVRRLSEGDATWRLKEFEAEVESISRVQHPNIVRLRAYYHADDEKLLVSDFIGNGISLYTALHGGGGPCASSLAIILSWAARLKIAQCTARALTHIHECCSTSSSPRKLHVVHGNIKSSKILLDDELRPYISGFGLARLCKTAAATTTHHKRNQLVAATTQKCDDVYSFGMVLLEMLTGKVPDASLDNFVRKVFREEKPLSELIDPALVAEVHAKKQVLSVFHTALNCTELLPELRPHMTTVCEALERVSC
ncbi:receptor protein kinase-like protein ZAR1 [Impatiens glandulifera]|uniref:receptor protein kinase-like protein ZAR1 n=1 Tax=Impatiens glandulifera TaxID=253017 RepID=UPI001FB0B461|nr:receptor protein kinase-like protein ZAR1 [Impatiens glandulifera]